MRKRRLIAWFIFKKIVDVAVLVMCGLGGFMVAQVAGLPSVFGMALAVLIILYMDTEYIQRKDRGPALKDYLPSGD